jgi:hypothetical protein
VVKDADDECSDREWEYVKVVVKKEVVKQVAVEVVEKRVAGSSRWHTGWRWWLDLEEGVRLGSRGGPGSGVEHGRAAIDDRQPAEWGWRTSGALEVGVD